ncbi:Extensin family protein [Methylocella tundrae]|uniref:Extensin family protein n=1 Tax=Methylocella tundrae TaxID=227605 RepID=A0A8B6M858_METTU|nr:extensin family protein [Methylocella tundrae]VTZ26906.1 Extensin family protein [Methylocella tundrae]VTZ50462.1 Extensin family protein [Methylocella tundrae]
MARRILPFVLIGALFGTLAGCSNYVGARRPPWRAQAENACFAQRPFQLSAYVQPAREIDGPGICGLTRPLRVTALEDGAVGFNAPYTLDCPMVAALNEWLRDVVQPTAEARFGQRVVEIIGMGAYSCRGMNGIPGARISEHAFGNAIDVGGFRLADGREISIVRDWTRGDDQTRAFLQDVHMGACAHFTTVLGPGANVFHYNHIHVDLAMHGNSSTGLRRICKPLLRPNPTPALPPDGLPDAPDLDEEIDTAQNKVLKDDARALQSDILQVGPGPGPTARIPDQYFTSAMKPPAPIPMTRPSTVRAYAPAPAPLPAASVPEGSPSEWDLTSSIPQRR